MIVWAFHVTLYVTSIPLSPHPKRKWKKKRLDRQVTYCPFSLFVIAYTNISIYTKYKIGTCVREWFGFLNLHVSSHAEVFLLCVLLWLIKLLASWKALGHWRHWYGLTPVWRLRWVSKPCRRENLFPHISQTKRRSSVWCVFWWLLQFPRLEKDLPQIGHWYGFSLVWIRWCAVKWLGLTKPAPQTSHFNDKPPWWICMNETK